MRGFLRSLAAQGRAVLVSSHLMSELQDTADHLVVIGRGKAIADASVADLIASASGNRVALRTTAQPDAMTVLAQAGAAPFSEVSAHRATLEDAYMELTRDAVEFRATTPAEVPR
jgi:ABC-2 type transport system ATP-binding protein